MAHQHSLESASSDRSTDAGVLEELGAKLRRYPKLVAAILALTTVEPSNAKAANIPYDKYVDAEYYQFIRDHGKDFSAEHLPTHIEINRQMFLGYAKDNFRALKSANLKERFDDFFDYLERTGSKDFPQIPDNMSWKQFESIFDSYFEALNEQFEKYMKDGKLTEKEKTVVLQNMKKPELIFLFQMHKEKDNITK